jgi:hypothetical protein
VTVLPQRQSMETEGSGRSKIGGGLDRNAGMLSRFRRFNLTGSFQWRH